MIKETKNKLMARSAFYLCGLLLAIIIYMNVQNKMREQARILAEQKAIEKLKQSHKEEIKKARDSMAIEKKLLTKEIGDLADLSKKLTNKIRNNEKRPSTDIDFVSAYSIIAESEYRPQGGNSNPR